MAATVALACQVILFKQDHILLSGQPPHLRREPGPAEQSEGLAPPWLAPSDAAGFVLQGPIDVRADGPRASLGFAEQDRVVLVVQPEHVDLPLVFPPASDPVDGERQPCAPPHGLAGDALVSDPRGVWTPPGTMANGFGLFERWCTRPYRMAQRWANGSRSATGAGKQAVRRPR